MIHRFSMDGRYIVLDTCSGAVHAVDALAYDLIGGYEETPRETLVRALAARFGETEQEVSEVYDEVTALKAQGRLFSPDTFAPLAGELKRKTAGVVKALCLHVAHTCNLN